jgi:hypothetical protein
MNHDPCLPVYDTASGATGGVTEQSKDGKHMKGIQFVVDDRGGKLPCSSISRSMETCGKTSTIA